ncbi:MAG: D-glycero-beta-D-manno-heptose 1-phosphate adenylyltransferase [Ignavibacteria bacterium]|nr:D-glycero-beta-D-manno-heptose 1-phosphate adenylyltransferase [Ignavibacteria bacterium]
MVVERRSIASFAEELRSSGKKIVFTNGCFDILHRGHAEYLAEARSLGDALIVAVNSDSSVKRLKGEGRPVNTEDDRAFMINALKPVDAVVIFSEDTPYEVISEIVPDVLVKGGDWKEEDIVGYDIVKKNGGLVKSLKFVDSYSTTSIINKISSAEQKQ